MNRIFNPENRFWSFTGKLIDVFVLHILWIILSVPIVTFGPATVALYYAIMTDVSGEQSDWLHAFFHSFRVNFKKAIPLGLIYLLFGIGLGYGIYFYSSVEKAGTLMSACKTLTIVFSVLYLFSFVYVFPLFARFENSIGITIRNSFLFSIKYLWKTILMVIVSIAPYVVILFTNFLPLILLGYGLSAYINSYILNPIFEPYIQELKNTT